MSAPPANAPHALALTATGVVKRFKTGRNVVSVLKGVDFTARHGDVTMVMGPSGSGKSTLIAALSGLLKPDEGTVSAMGEDLWGRGAGKIDRAAAAPRAFVSDRRGFAAGLASAASFLALGDARG